MSASAFSLTATVPAGAFRVVDGEPVKGGLRGPDVDHYFCSSCESWVFTRIVGLDAFVNVRPTMFDDPKWSRPFIETMTRDKLPWAQTSAVHSFEGFPAMDELAKLMGAYSSQR